MHYGVDISGHAGKVEVQGDGTGKGRGRSRSGGKRKYGMIQKVDLEVKAEANVEAVQVQA